jgi:hypothetical protein
MNSLHSAAKVMSRAAAIALTGLALTVLFAGVAVPAQAQTVNTLDNFNSNSNNSEPIFPQGNMAQGRDGNFYGISQSGNGCCQGIFYKISSTGVLTPLRAISQSEGTNCRGLTLGTDGNFYGTCVSEGW